MRIGETGASPTPFMLFFRIKGKINVLETIFLFNKKTNMYATFARWNWNKRKIFLLSRQFRVYPTYRGWTCPTLGQGRPPSGASPTPLTKVTFKYDIIVYGNLCHFSDCAASFRSLNFVRLCREMFLQAGIDRIIIIVAINVQFMVFTMFWPLFLTKIMFKTTNHAHIRDQRVEIYKNQCFKKNIRHLSFYHVFRP